MSFNIPNHPGTYTGEIPVKGGENIIAGGIHGVDANGRLIADPTAAAKIIGRADTPADNTDGANGDIKVPLRRGVFEMDNSAIAGVDDTHLGATLYIEDNTTVASAQAATEPAAGKCVGITPAGGILVEIL